MPLDCADAVLYLDASARGDTPDSDDPSQSCLDLTMNASDATESSESTESTDGALDPGTVRTGTEPACLVLVSEYSATDVSDGASPDYAAARQRCDVPRRS